MLNKGILMNKKEKGLTLIESLVVVGILLGIVAIALTLYGTVMNRLNVKNESENISFMFAQVTDLFSEEGTDDLNNELALQAGIIPKKMRVVNGTVYNAWDGKLTIEQGNGANSFEIKTEKVPSGDVCVNLVRNQRKVGWDSYEVGTQGEAYSEMKTTSVSKNCNSANDRVTVTFIKSED